MNGAPARAPPLRAVRARAEGLIAFSWPSPFLRKDVEVFVVLAHPVKQLGIGHQLPLERNTPWLCVRLGIVDRDLHVHSSDVHAPEALDNVQRFAVRMTGIVQPRLFMNARRVDDEGVALPAADRIAEPRWLGILRQRASVG